MSLHRSSRRALAVAITLATVLAACGSSSISGPTEPTSAPTTSASATTVESTLPPTSAATTSSRAVSGTSTTVAAAAVAVTSTTAKPKPKPQPKPAPTTVPAPTPVTIVVFAATSLTAAFNDIKGAFEAAYPYITVTTSYGASSTLATNINNGAPADVFASADYANINRISMAGGATRVVRNRLEIIVQPGNPKGIATLADLAAPGVLYVTAAPGVPIRTYADQALASAGVTVAPVSFEANVGAIVTKVTSGSADAGIVYRTDVLNAGASALGVVIPDANNVIAEYPAAVPSGSSHQAEANLFINFLLSATGQNLLINRGFIGA